MLLLVFAACSLGLQAVEGDVIKGGTPDSGEDFPAIEEDLTGNLYIIQPDGFRISSPSGLDAYQNMLFTRPLLIYVSDQAKNRLQLALTVGAEDGSQNHCEAVRNLPTADFAENPTFTLGPGDVRSSFSGQPASLYKFKMEATFAEEGDNLRQGTLTAMLKVSELQAVIPEVSCELVDSIGGECRNCPGDGEDCFNLEISSLSGSRTRGADFDPRETGDCQ